MNVTKPPVTKPILAANVFLNKVIATSVKDIAGKPPAEFHEQYLCQLGGRLNFVVVSRRRN